jgi:putative addiction module component (TIGR02574 family)
MTKQEILDNAKHLSREDQVDLAMELWDMVDLKDDELQLTAEICTELDRRMADADTNPQTPEEIESLKTRLLRGDF